MVQSSKPVMNWKKINTIIGSFAGLMASSVGIFALTPEAPWAAKSEFTIVAFEFASSELSRKRWDHNQNELCRLVKWLLFVYSNQWSSLYFVARLGALVE